MRPPSRHHAGDDRGTAAVEFAMIASLLFVLVFGIVDFGRAWNQQETLTQLAREGARLSALGVSNVPSRVVSAAPASLHLTTANVSVTACSSTSTATVDTTVRVSTSFSFITPVAALAHFTAGPITLAGTAAMPCLG